jgi:hypothetical protein
VNTGKEKKRAKARQQAYLLPSDTSPRLQDARVFHHDTTPPRDQVAHDLYPIGPTLRFAIFRKWNAPRWQSLGESNPSLQVENLTS